MPIRVREALDEDFNPESDLADILTHGGDDWLPRARAVLDRANGGSMFDGIDFETIAQDSALHTRLRELFSALVKDRADHARLYLSVVGSGAFSLYESACAAADMTPGPDDIHNARAFAAQLENAAVEEATRELNDKM